MVQDEGTITQNTRGLQGYDSLQRVLVDPEYIDRTRNLNQHSRTQPPKTCALQTLVLQCLSLYRAGHARNYARGEDETMTSSLERSRGPTANSFTQQVD